MNTRCAFSARAHTGVGVVHNGHEIRKRGRLRIIGWSRLHSVKSRGQSARIANSISPPLPLSRSSLPRPQAHTPGPLSSTVPFGEGDENRDPAGYIHIWITRSFALASPHRCTIVHVLLCTRARRKAIFFFFLSGRKKKRQSCRPVIVRFYSNVYRDLPGLRLAQCGTENRISITIWTHNRMSLSRDIRAYTMPIKPYDTHFRADAIRENASPSSSTSPRIWCAGVERKP